MNFNKNKSLEEAFKDLSKDENEFERKCIDVVNNISQKSIRFLDFVEALEVFLTHESPGKRELGINILSKVLELLPPELINVNELGVTANYYVDRLNDHHQVVPAVLGGILVLLTNFQHLGSMSIKNLLLSIFKNVACQQQQQLDRYNIYNIFKISWERISSSMFSLMTNYLTVFKALQTMDLDFIYGVMVAIDGERDPRNLLFLFKWLPMVLERFELAHLTEEMFEVMACYFPIDFRAPEEFMNKIRRKDLAIPLCNCLCAVPEFSEYCLPLALEKLNSSLQIAKVDSLHLIQKGCETFPLTAYVHHSTDIWSQIQQEVFSSNNEDLEELALNTLKTVMNKLSQNSDNIYKPFLSDITDTLKGNLLPGMRLFTPSCRILCAVAYSSSTAAIYIVEEVVPEMINTYNMSTTPSHQVLILKNLLKFVTAHIELLGNENISQVKQLTSIPSLCYQASVHSDIEVKKVGFQSLSLICKSIPFEIRKCIYQNFREFLIAEQNEEVRHYLLNCFKTVSELYGDEVQEYVLPKVKISDNKVLSRYLESLSIIVQIERFTETVFKSFLGYYELDLTTAEVATGIFEKLLEMHENNCKILRVLEQLQVVYKLVGFVITHIDDINIRSVENQKLLQSISTICKTIIAKETKERQWELINNTLDEVVARNKHNSNMYSILLYDNLLMCVHQGINIKYNFLEEILKASLYSEIEYIQNVAVQLLANMLNKEEDDSRLQCNLCLVATSCDKKLDCLEKNDVPKLVSVISWVTKALVMRGHAQSEHWTKKLLALLESHEEAANGFHIIMEQNAVTLTTKSHSNIRILYRQKFFMEMSTILTENYSEGKSNYLLAMGCLLQNAPKQAFIMQFKKIVKIIILCLEKCRDINVLCVILQTFCELIKYKEQITEDYIQELLSRFIVLSKFESSMNVRIKALRCIQHFAHGYPLYKLLPHKQNIVQSLTKCLDDKKRLVRKEAVDARLSWIMLDMPT
ncbi:hypothetical protein FQA39_LY00778 [Lamprigera yunnana]|nr:hypothetical protein FQA39_LY00778 [Lamprigera yunnana]